MNAIKNLLLIIIILLPSVLFTENSNKIEYKKYSNVTYNFSILLPNTWVHTETKTKDEFLITLEKDKYTNIKISIANVKLTKDWLKYPYTKVNKNSKKILESGLDTFKNKIVGKILVFEYKHDKKNIILRSYLIKYDNFMMLVECRSTIEHFYEYNEVFNTVMSSLNKYESEFEVDLPDKITYNHVHNTKIKISYNETEDKDRHKTYTAKIDQKIEIQELKNNSGYEYTAKHNKVEITEDGKAFDNRLNEILQKIILKFKVNQFGTFTHVTGYKNYKDEIKNVFPLYKEGSMVKQLEKYIIYFINYESMINSSKVINRENIEIGKQFISVYTYQNPAGEKVSCYLSGIPKETLSIAGKKFFRIDYFYCTDLEYFSKELKLVKTDITQKTGTIENNLKDMKYYIQGAGQWIYNTELKLVFSDVGKRKVKYTITNTDKKKGKYTHDVEIDEELKIIPTVVN